MKIKMIDNYQNFLFPYAYNIVGTADDAKDVVQEVMESYLSIPKIPDEDERKYLIKSVINRAINAKIKSSRLISENSVWLPEPVATSDAADLNLHLRDILSYSLLVLLEKLSAKERAVFILKESFSYSHEEIADILSFSREQSRKLLSRAKATLFKPLAANSRSKKAKTNEKILDNYIAAIRNRDLQTLEQLLIDEITLCADGGDHIQVVQKIASGAPVVTEISLYVFHNYLFKSEIKVGELNHQPALLYYNNGKITSCQIFNLNSSGRITQICSIVDPQKLKNLNVNLG